MPFYQNTYNTATYTVFYNYDMKKVFAFQLLLFNSEQYYPKRLVMSFKSMNISLHLLR